MPTPSAKLAPFSEYLRAVGMTRGQGYDEIHRNQLPIPVVRLGSRYYVAESDLAKLRPGVAK
jgi:hypothetical protein